MRPTYPDHRELYRLPWSLTDNVIDWLEPTRQCNLHCEGCYSTNAPGSHKSLEQIDAELDTFERFRRTDAVSIAGGDPLTHPEIVAIVRAVARRGRKPIVNTNGLALTPDLLRELKRAGLRGFTFHVDSGQKRPGWTGSDERALNELRLYFAEAVSAVGGLSCAFNATVYEETLEQVPDVVAWGLRHADKVHVLVFIAFRAASLDGRFDYWVGGRRIDVGPLAYGRARPQRADISSPEILEAIRHRFPEITPCAYLNGTEKPDSMKWLMSLPISDGRRFLGSAGPKFIELAQVWNHLAHGRYLGYVPPRVHAAARGMLLLSGLDRGLRAVLGRDLRRLFTDPFRLFRPLRLQSIMIIQPVDTLADGRQSMCDSCPDVTVHDGQLVWSCRMEERLRLGGLMRAEPVAHN